MRTDEDNISGKFQFRFVKDFCFALKSKPQNASGKFVNSCQKNP